MNGCLLNNKRGFVLLITIVMLFVFSAVTLHALAMFDREKGFLIMEVEHTYAEQYFDNGIAAVKEAIISDSQTNITLTYEEGGVDILTEEADNEYDVVITALYESYQLDRRYIFDQNGQVVRRIR